MTFLDKTFVYSCLKSFDDSLNKGSLIHQSPRKIGYYVSRKGHVLDTAKSKEQVFLLTRCKSDVSVKRITLSLTY